MTPDEIRAALDEIELVNNKIHGYGSANFARNMSECYRRLAERDIQDDDLKTIMSFAERIMHHPMELIDGVNETLEYLCTRHDLVLFTKGHAEEQKLKIDRAGVSVFFGHTAIVKEKDAEAYATLVKERGFDVERTWMIGNSPKSDINPALKAGLNAVFVPHEKTWHLEKADLMPGSTRLITVEKFADLRIHF
jgi:putative hydrolase of the HAD superfamily